MAGIHQQPPNRSEPGPVASEPAAGAHARNDTTLVRCEVVNRHDEPSMRYIELPQFRLWQYMMINRHGIRVVAARLALWVPAADYAVLQDYYDRAGTIEPVDRIGIDSYDPELGVSHRLLRFVPSTDSELALERLLDNLPAYRNDPERFSIDRASGYAVVKQRIEDLRLLEAGRGPED